MINIKVAHIKGAAIALAAIFVTTWVLKATPTLNLGDPAPKLQISKWVQGDPLKELPAGKPAIVEFWATWCPPCRASIPHLNELYTKFKDKGLVVIGVDSTEEESVVAEFVKKMGTTMTYRVAIDDRAGDEKGGMAAGWMEAAGRNGIPTAFLVDAKGRLVWIGHPMEITDKLLEEVIAGNYDVTKAKAESEKAEKNQAQLQAAEMAVNGAIQRGDWDEVLIRLAELEKLLPPGTKNNLEQLRFKALLSKGDYAAAYQVATKISDANKDEAMLQYSLASQILNDKGNKDRDLKLAETFATRANDAAKGKDPVILDTLARVKFMQGDKDAAINLAEKAVMIAGAQGGPRFQNNLDSYKKGELPTAD